MSHLLEERAKRASYRQENGQPPPPAEATGWQEERELCWEERVSHWLMTLGKVISPTWARVFCPLRSWWPLFSSPKIWESPFLLLVPLSFWALSWPLQLFTKNVLEKKCFAVWPVPPLPGQAVEIKTEQTPKTDIFINNRKIFSGPFFIEV